MPTPSAPDLVEIRTREDALRLLEQWQEAYEHNIRFYARALNARDEILWQAESEAFIWRHQAALYRAQLVMAGVKPMDALAEAKPAERLVESECPF